MGFYLEISSAGVRTRFGYRPATSRELTHFRYLINDPASGEELNKLVLRFIKDAKWDLVERKLKIAPRGYTLDHPRIQLLHLKSFGIEQLLSREAHMALDNPCLYFKSQIQALNRIQNWFTNWY